MGRCTNLECLLPGLVRRIVDDGIVLRAREVFVLERVEGALEPPIFSHAKMEKPQLTHSQLMAISASSSMPKFLIFGIFPMRSI